MAMLVKEWFAGQDELKHFNCFNKGLRRYVRMTMMNVWKSAKELTPQAHTKKSQIIPNLSWQATFYKLYIIMREVVEAEGSWTLSNMYKKFY